MKKSEAAKKILKVLESWEGSQLEMKTAREVLAVVEKEIGMLPPNRKVCFCHDCECLPDHSWEPEKKR